MRRAYRIDIGRNLILSPSRPRNSFSARPTTIAAGCRLRSRRRRRSAVALARTLRARLVQSGPWGSMSKTRSPLRATSVAASSSPGACVPLLHAKVVLNVRNARHAVSNVLCAALFAPRADRARQREPARIRLPEDLPYILLSGCQQCWRTPELGTRYPGRHWRKANSSFRHAHSSPMSQLALRLSG